MTQARKSVTENTYLDMDGGKIQETTQDKSSEEGPSGYKEPQEPSSGGDNAEQPPVLERSNTEMENPIIEMTYLHMAIKEKTEKYLKLVDDVKTRNEESSDANQCGYKESEKPMPMPSSNWSPARESNPTPEISPSIEMMYLHKADEKYLEIVDDVTIEEEKSADEGHIESGTEEPMPCRPTSSAKFNALLSPAPESSSALGVTLNIMMTCFTKNGEKKVEMCRYMSLDHNVRRVEEQGRYEAPMPGTCSTGVYELPSAQESSNALRAAPTAENLNTDDDYDDVMTENENSTDVSPSGYEEPDVVNTEPPPVPERRQFPRMTDSATSTRGETSVCQELQLRKISLENIVHIIKSTMKA